MNPSTSSTSISNLTPAKQNSAPLASPQVDGFKIKAAVKGSLKEVALILRSISFLQIAPEKGALNVIYVESSDINKVPYLFSILKMKEDELEVLYSIPAEISPKKRRMDVIAYLLNILSLVELQYSVENKAVYQLMEEGVKELTSSVTLDYTKLYTAYDSMKKDVEDYKKKIERLNDQAQALTSKNYELKSMNDELKLRLAELDTLSDDTLKLKLQEWLSEHSGSIVVSDFAKLYHVPESRIETMLNRLVNEGYLEVAQ